MKKRVVVSNFNTQSISTINAKFQERAESLLDLFESKKQELKSQGDPEPVIAELLEKNPDTYLCLLDDNYMQEHIRKTVMYEAEQAGYDVMVAFFSENTISPGSVSIPAAWGKSIN